MKFPQAVIFFKKCHFYLVNWLRSENFFSQEAPRGEKWRKECLISESQWSFLVDQMLNYSTNYSAKNKVNLHLLRDRTCRFMIYLGLKIVIFVNFSASIMDGRSALL